MKNKLPEDLKIAVVDNKIVNTENILAALMKENNSEMLKEYYDFLINNANIKIYEDMDVIIAAVKSRIHILDEQLDLKKEMEEIKKRNKQLESLSLIEDPKERNDSKKDLTYLKYVDDSGKTHLLEITNKKKFLELFTTIAPTITAEEFYNLLKTRYFHELEHLSLGKDKIDLFNYENNYLIKDKASFIVEKDLLYTYINLNHPNIVPEISIDSNDERIYYVGSIIIKFHDESGKRKMEIISEGLDKENNKEETNVNTNSFNETAYKDNIEDEITRNDLDRVYVETEEVRSLINRYIYNNSLEKNELIKVYAYLLNVLDIMDLELSVSNTDKELLGVCIDYLREKELNSIEAEIVSRYDKLMKKEEEAYKLENAGAKEKLLLNEALTPNDHGASLSIIVITVTVLLGALIATIVLVN